MTAKNPITYPKKKVAIAVNYAIEEKAMRQNRIASICNVPESTVNAWKKGELNAKYQKIKPLLELIGPIPVEMSNHFYLIFPDEFTLSEPLMNGIIASLPDLEYPYSNNYEEILLFIRDLYAEKEYSDLFRLIHTISSNDWINDSITGSQGQFIPETTCEVCKKTIETGHQLPHIYKKRILQWLVFKIVSQLQNEVIVSGDLILSRSIKHLSATLLNNSVFVEYKIDVYDLLDGSVLLLEGFKTDYQDKHENYALMGNWFFQKYGPMMPQDLVDLVKTRSEYLGLQVSRSLSFLLKSELVKRNFEVKVDEIVAGKL